MIPPTQWDISEQVLGGTGVLAGAAYFVQKMMTFWKNEANNQASAAATTANYESLRKQIEAVQVDNSLLRHAFNEMDIKLHRQQTKLTRTEMLVRQFVGLMRQHGTPIPEFMQAELNDLIKTDNESETI
jgi:hypothetical protein